MKKGLALLLCVGLALTALAGCSGKTKEMQKVTVCEVTHSIFYAPQYVAHGKGLLRGRGAGRGAFQRRRRGQSDERGAFRQRGHRLCGAGGQHLCIQRGQRGLHRGVCAGNEMRRQLFWWGAKRTTAFTWDKLAGKHILPGRKGGVPYMAFEYAIRKNGMDPASRTCCWTTASSSTT